jgi:uncharacterized protein (TIGR04255 family)
VSAIPRSLPALVLERSPLVYFLGQVRFSPILSMGDHVKAIHERLRAIGYPVYGQMETQTVTIAPSGPTIEKVTLWHFKDVADETGVVLASNFVSFQTLKYRRYEEELPRILEVLEAVHDIVKIDVLERCGLRYLDVVYPDKNAGQAYDTYLQPEIVGLTGESINIVPIMSSSIFAGTTEVGTLVVKFSTSTSPQILPLDLAGPPLSFKTDIPQGEAIGILDFDHFVDRRETFDLTRTAKYLAELHDAIARAFNQCTTPKARELWGKREVE